MLTTPITTPPQSKKARAAAIRAAAQQCFANTRQVDATIFAKALRDRRIETTRQLKWIIETSGYLELNAHTVTLTNTTFAPKPTPKTLAPPPPPPPSSVAAAATAPIMGAAPETVVKSARLEPSTTSAPPPPINTSVTNHSALNGTHSGFKSRVDTSDQESVSTSVGKAEETPSSPTVVTDDTPVSATTTTTKRIEPLSFQCDTKAIRYVLGDLEFDELDLDDLDLTDIFIDVGFNMSAKIGGRTVQLNQVIDYLDLDSIVDRLPGLFPNGKQNRVIFGATLHRAAAVLYKGEITGISIRVGRKVSGLWPVLEGMMDGKSILLCGAPNVGKTTTLRDLCLYLSRHHCLCLIDTSGEVCGDTATRKEYTGTSRVFRPEDPDQQNMTFVDCVRNHSPDIIAMDELNTKEDVEVCQTIAMRSIQMIACVHGDIEDLLYNPILNKTLGGSTEALVSDMNAVDGRKVVHQRTARPIFDIVVNIKKTPEGLEYTFIDDISNNIRDMLEGNPIQTVTRTIAGDELRETTQHVVYRCAL